MSPTALDRRAWLRLARTHNVGPSTFAALIRAFRYRRRPRSPKFRVWRAAAARTVSPSRASADIDREIERLTQFGGRLIYSCDRDFPSGLAALDAPPPVISVVGRSELLARDMIAMVGARNASALGRKFAGAACGRAGTCGPCRRLRAWRAASTPPRMKARSRPAPCAVVAGGIDIIYPPENAQPLRAHRKGRRHRLRNAVRPDAPGAPFPAAQPHHLRACRAAWSSWKRRKVRVR